MAIDDESQIELLSRLSVPRYATRLRPTVIPTARWDDEPRYGICINDEWISHILGVMVALDQPDTWIGTKDEIYAARQQVNEIMVAFMEQCDPMNNCCPEPLTRINSDGTMQVSYDGGMTWQDATTEDPRKTAPQLPPIDDGDGADKKCKAANRVVRQMKDLQTSWADSLGAGLSVVQLALQLAAALIVFALDLEGLAAILWPAFLSLSAAIVGTGTDAYNDLFTDDVWNILLCKVYCNVGEDGQFSQSQFLALRTDLDSAGFDGTVALAFSSALNGWQVDGLNNAAKIPTSDNLDCSDCDCGGCDLSLWTVDYGTIVTQTATELTVTGTLQGDSLYYAVVHAPTSADCCCIGLTGIDPHFQNLNTVRACGLDPSLIATNSDGMNTVNNTDALLDVVAYLTRSFGVFTVTLTSTPC